MGDRVWVDGGREVCIYLYVEISKVSVSFQSVFLSRCFSFRAIEVVWGSEYLALFPGTKDGDDRL